MSTQYTHEGLAAGVVIGNFYTLVAGETEMKLNEMKEEDFNEVTISINGETVAKSSGPSPALEMLIGLVGELRKREGVDCPGCGRPITPNNAGGYRTFCGRCVAAFPPFPNDGEGHLIAEGCHYPNFRWD